MSKRLQLLFGESEWNEMQRLAQSQQMTVDEWVRQTLRAARRDGSLTNPRVKIAAIRSGMRHAHPTADIDQMNAEIEWGYLGTPER